MKNEPIVPALEPYAKWPGRSRKSPKRQPINRPRTFQARLLDAWMHFRNVKPWMLRPVLHSRIATDLTPAPTEGA